MSYEFEQSHLTYSEGSVIFIPVVLPFTVWNVAITHFSPWIQVWF